MSDIFKTIFTASEENSWKVRYFASACKVSLCGPATISLGAALAGIRGDWTYALKLDDGQISVQYRLKKRRHRRDYCLASDIKPPCRSRTHCRRA